MSKQLRADEGGRPWCIQPELTRGCTMRHGSGPGGLCHFCGLTAIRSGPGEYEFMSVETAKKIAEDAATWSPKLRIEYAMRGEPLMNPHHLEIFKIFKSALSSSSHMVTTNGDTIRTPPGKPFHRLQEQAEKIFDSGLNFILLDTYYPKERRDQLREEAYSLKDIQVVDFFQDWMPKGISPYSRHDKLQRTVVIMDDISIHDGEHSSRLVKTHAGANQTKSIPEPLHRNCGRPFREMTFTAEGDFMLCCDDWQLEYKIGSIHDFTLSELWQHPRLEAARARLMQKDRSWGPCAQCDAPMAPRTGLLPHYDPPTPEQIALTESTFQSKVPLWKLTPV